LRRSFADRLLTIQPREDGLALVAVNDSREPWALTATVSRRALSGLALDQDRMRATVAPGAAVTLPLRSGVADVRDRTAELLVADAGDQRAWWFFAEDKDIAWPRAAYDARVKSNGDSTTVTVTAQQILRDLTLHPDRLDPDAEIDEAGVTLLPGESTTFTITRAKELDPTALTTRPVLRCVND